MRHLRARRRFKAVLVLLLAFSLIILFEARVESFAPQLKVFTESKIEAIFDNSIKLDIGSMEGGILHPFAVNGCKVTDSAGTALFPALEIDSIRSNYRLWDVLFNRYNPCIDVKFALNDRNIIGFARVEAGSARQIKIKGYINIMGTDRVELIGEVKDRFFEAEFKSKYGVVKAEGTLSRDNELAAKLSVGHMQLGSFDIIFDAIIKNKFAPEHIEGELETRKGMVNYRPFMELKASYNISNDLLQIKSMEIGDGLKLYGKISLGYPHNLDMTIVADNLNLGQVLTSMNAQETVALSGMLNGKFELKGPVGNPRISGRMEIREGEIGTLDFDYLSARLKGEGPVIRIEDSRINRQSGSFVLAGEINLSTAGRGNIFEDVKLASDETAILWDGMDTKRVQNVQEVKMEKQMNEDIKLGFKKYLSDVKVDESLRDTDEVELKYKIDSKESLKVKMGQDNGNFFGWEHEDKF